MVITALLSVCMYLSATFGEHLGYAIGRFFFRKFWLNVAIALYITGCGADDSVVPKAKNETPTEVSAQEPRTTPAPESEEISPSEWPEALLVSTKEDLPECSGKNKRQLVYVQETAEFQNCNGKEWAVARITAPAGEKGPKGDAGASGAAAPYVGPDEWIEPVTGQKFFLGGAFNRTQHAACPTGTYFPSQTTVSAAVQAGLFERFSSYAATNNSHLWLGDGKTLYIGSVMTARTGSILDYAWGSDPNAGTTYHRTLCVK